MAVYSNITIDQGTDFSSSIDVTDADGDAVNLTGYTVKGQIRKTYTSSTFVNLTCAVSNATAGIVSIALTAAQSNAMKPGRFVYAGTSKFKMTNSLDGNNLVINSGTY